MKIKNITHAGVHGKWIPNEHWNRIVELVRQNDELIKELKGELNHEC